MTAAEEQRLDLACAYRILAHHNVIDAYGHVSVRSASNPNRYLLAKHLAIYQKDSASAAALLKVGLAPPPTDIDQAELAAWTHVARVLLNLHEMITRS